MASVFIADLHLSLTGRREDSKAFGRFLEELTSQKEVDRLFILGDLFTYWYEHPKVDIYGSHPAFRALRNFRSRGKKVYFLRGNRDFMAGPFFKKHSKVNFIGDSYIINTPQKRIYLTHGDMLAKKDIRYRMWSAFIRFPLASFIFKRLPVESAIALVDRFKEVGKKAPASEEVIAEMITEEARRQFKKESDVIITGHAHYRVSKCFTINKKEKFLYILPEFSYPGEFLFLNDRGELTYRCLS
ncbi:MAG: UDP-2,3-diacylglucosamine diphosphatase [Elusimicrobiota bacterium]|nr:UDP-2,3-diacylglucosamine diphosphatase [Elusimicrobiota bacterium]